MKVKPLADRVLIEPNPAEEKTAGGLFIPDTAKEKPLAGKVIAVGPGTSDVKMEVKVGDQVLYGKYAGTEITIDGKDLLIMKQGDILLTGHTHIPACEEILDMNGGKYQYLNPGSVSIPKEGSEHSYMIYENGVFTWKNLAGEEYQTWKTVSHS